MLDHCGEYRREINALVGALSEQVAVELTTGHISGVPPQVLFPRLALRLYDRLGLDKDLAKWAVESWALALGILSEDALVSSSWIENAEAGAGRKEEEGQQPALLLKLAADVVMEFVRVPAGEFLMGSDKVKDNEAHEDELPQHKLTLPKYLIGKYPVTVAQFAAFVKATGYQTAADKAGSGWNWLDCKWQEIKGASWQQPRGGPANNVVQKANHPVTLVSWPDAAAFCRWASEVGATGRSSSPVRLPTEPEWEKAARGADRRLCPGGSEPPDNTRCNFNKNVKDTTPVGQYSPRGDGPFGCADLAGNVWEWTSSLYGRWDRQASKAADVYKYPYQARDGRENMAAGAGFCECCAAQVLGLWCPGRACGFSWQGHPRRPERLQRLSVCSLTFSTL